MRRPSSIPIFGRDIGFFLFELPFLRLVQGLFNGLVVATLIVVLVRYVIGATRGGLVFATPVRIHLAVLGGLFLLSVAFGYQLDKYELVYSTRGVATGVSFTDQNAQFFAFDLLTVVSGLAAAFLVGGAFTRLIWPLGLTLGVWFLASIVVGRLYPEAVQRFTVVPNQFAQEERYIGNNIAMTRLAFDLEGWEDRPFHGDEPVTQALVDSEEDTFRNARLWDYRPLQDTLDQLQTVRTLLRLPDVDTDRYVDRRRPAPGDAVGARAGPRPEPERDRLGQPADRLHPRHRRRDGAGQRGDQRGPAAALHRQPAAAVGRRAPRRSPSRGSTSASAPSDYVVVGAKQAEFDYPTGEGDDAAAAGTETHWTGHDRHQARYDPACGCCSRSASATSTCSSATRSPGTASSCSIAR